MPRSVSLIFLSVTKNFQLRKLQTFGSHVSRRRLKLESVAGPRAPPQGVRMVQVTGDRIGDDADIGRRWAVPELGIVRQNTEI